MYPDNIPDKFVIKFCFIITQSPFRLMQADLKGEFMKFLLKTQLYLKRCLGLYSFKNSLEFEGELEG